MQHKHSPLRGSNRLSLVTLAALLAVGAGTACSGASAQSATSSVVGKVVEVGKGATTGVVDGVSRGRKASESVDGATIVQSWDELSEVGDVVVYRVAGAGERTVVTLAFENKSDAPIRVSDLTVLGIDGEGFALQPFAADGAWSLTVPPHARERIDVVFTARAIDVHKVRVWEHDLVRLPDPSGETDA